MASDSDVDQSDNNNSSSPIPHTSTTQHSSNPPISTPDHKHTLGIQWNGDDVENFVDDVPVETLPRLEALTFKKEPSPPTQHTAADHTPFVPCEDPALDQPFPPPEPPQSSEQPTNPSQIHSQSAPPSSFPSIPESAPTDESHLQQDDHPTILPGYHGVSSRAAIPKLPSTSLDQLQNLTQSASTTHHSPAIAQPSIPSISSPASDSPHNPAVGASQILKTSSRGTPQSQTTKGVTFEDESHNTPSSLYTSPSYHPLEKATSQSDVDPPTWNRANSSKSRSGRRMSGLRQSLRNCARFSSLQMPSTRRQLKRAARLEAASEIGRCNGGSSSDEAFPEGEPSFGDSHDENATNSFPAQNRERPLSTHSEGLPYHRDDHGSEERESQRPISFPQGKLTHHTPNGGIERGNVTFQKAVVYQTRKTSNKAVQLFTPLTSEFSFLECVNQMLKGAVVLKKKHIMNAMETCIWLSPDIKAIKYRLCRKGVATETIALTLDEIRKVKGTDRDLHLDLTRDKKSVEFVFPTTKQLDIWLSGLCCLVPTQTSVKKHQKHFQDRREYDPLLDLWMGKTVASRKQLREFLLLGTIGKGTTCKVKVALSTTDRTFYAVKVLSKREMQKESVATFGHKKRPTLADFSMNSLVETQIMKDLRHDNIVQLFAVFEEDKWHKLYYVLEYMPRGAVMSLTEKTTLPEDDARSAFIDILAGVEYLHRNNIVHRDLKPENLLRAGDGTVKINDFGAAVKFQDNPGSAPEPLIGFLNIQVGTPAFTAPELCLSDHAPQGPERFFESDIWSLGATLFYFIYGRPPYVAANIFVMYDLICTKDVGFPEDPEVSPDLKQLILDMLEKDPRRRASIPKILKSPWLANDAVIAERLATLRRVVESQSA